MKNPILPDTSLCAIVRDEVMNPAGGIVDFIESTMPFVEAGIIVDTGSIDGTQKLLKEMEGKYPNLKVVYDHKFDGYASSRNVSLSKLKTKRALILDADERLTKDDFHKLSIILNDCGKEYEAFNFLFLNVSLDEEKNVKNHNPRLFEYKKDIMYQDHIKFAEHLFQKRGKWLDKPYIDSTVNTTVAIKHFVTAHDVKLDDWYGLLKNELALKGTLAGFDVAPSEIPSYKQWKAYNPRRESYR